MEMDLVDVLLQLAEDREQAAERPPEARLTRDGVKAFLLDIIGGGTETAAATLEWAVLELLRHPAAMEAATGECNTPDCWAPHVILLTHPSLEAPGCSRVKIGHDAAARVARDARPVPTPCPSRRALIPSPRCLTPSSPP